MAAITAFAHLGFPHPNDGGLHPDYLFLLSEGSRPAWVLEASGELRCKERILEGRESLVWVPTLDHMIEDLLVLVGTRIVRDEELLGLFRDQELDPMLPRIEMYDVPERLRRRLYARARELDGSWKIGLTIFSGSHLEGRLEALEGCRCQVEVCTSGFVRYRDRWNNGEVEVQGRLRS